MSGKHRHLNPETLVTPRGYTHVVEASGGRMLFIAGQVAFDRDGKVVGIGDFQAQAERVFANLKAALAVADADLTHVVKTTTFIRNLTANAPLLRPIRERHLPAPPPANTLVEINQLAHPDLLLEIEAVAIVPA